MNFLLNRKWNGETDITLHKFLAKHRASFHLLQRCGYHVTVEIQSERMREGHLLDNIEVNDKDVSAALSYVCLDDNVNGTRNDFERAVDFLLLNEPVKNKKKRGHVHICYVSAHRTAGKGKGIGQGKWGKKASFKISSRNTGADLR